MHTLRIRKFASAIGLTLGLAATLRSQQSTPPPVTTDTTTTTVTTATGNGGETPSDTVILSPFTVDTSTDVGYTAVNSLAGGRNNTPLAITPSVVTSLTKQFMVLHVLLWVSG
jgi:hypothetical protein